MGKRRMKSSARKGDPCVQWVIVTQVRWNQSFEIRLTERQRARAQVFCSHPVCFLTSDSELDLNLCLCFSLSQIPQFIFPVGFCRILKNASFLPSFSIKHIYISWLGVLSEKYFIFFLIALFAFKFLNFHGLHGCVYTSVGWGFFPLHVLVPWTYDPHRLWEWLARPCFFLFMFLFFWRLEWYLENKCITKFLSAHMKEQASALENAGKLYHMF